MEEKELKTSWKQRFWIILIAVVMLGSIIASYAAIVINGNSSKSSSSSSDIATITEEKKAEYAAAYEEKKNEFKEATKSDYKEFIKYKSEEIKAYNEAAANGVDVKTEDLKEGNGETITDGTEYYAYYVGWCADETVFDSSFDNNTDPTGFERLLDGSTGLIEGWKLGVEGMKMNGIRVITIPGALAYGESSEICGGYNKPLKFMIMAKRKSDERTELYMEMEKAMLRAEYANYGIDYEQLMVVSE